MQVNSVVKDAALKKLLTPNEVAEILLVSPTTVRFWAHKGALKALTTPGGHRRFNYEDVEAFAHSRGMDLQRKTNTTRILIVDDEVVLGEFLVEFFKSIEGVETEVANYSFEAGLKYKSFKPQVVLLDIMMPGLNGFQVCKMMKADPAYKDVRVIAMTGYPSAENIEKILAAGAEVCMEKPIDTEQLLSLLELKVKKTGN
ncbi:MAG: response regulator [Gammaproteobacteria bacterium]|nr:response regulator [Gammaproteobacteria bacterium]